MALGLLGMMLFGGVEIPVGFGDGLQSRHGSGLAVFPMVCVSIACGAISGFHATQRPLMARCLKNERYARPVFSGARVTHRTAIMATAHTRAVRRLIFCFMTVSSLVIPAGIFGWR